MLQIYILHIILTCWFQPQPSSICNPTVMATQVQSPPPRRSNQAAPAPNKIPPIKVLDLNVKQFIQELPLIAEQNNYECAIPLFSCMSGNITLIYTDDAKQHGFLMAVMKLTKRHAYSWAPPECRPIKLLLKGIPHDFDPLKISDAIRSIDPELAPCGIVTFNTPKARRHNWKMSDWIVSFNPGTKFAAVKMALKTILNHEVTWERFKSKSVFQCHNCLRFGHVSRYCTYPYRCVKCDQSHEPGQCARPQLEPDAAEDTRPPPFCNGCNQAGHVASWRGCPEAVKAEKVRTRAHAPKMPDCASQPPSPTVSSASAVWPGNSNDSDFAQRNAPSAGPAPTINNADDIFVSAPMELFGCDLATLIARASEFKRSISSLGEEEQKLALEEFIRSFP